MRINFAYPYFTDENIKNITYEIQESLRSGILTNGPKVKKLEEYIAKLTNRKYCIATNSATAGLHVVLSYIKSIKKVTSPNFIVQANTFASSALIGKYTQIKVKFIDIDSKVWSLSPELLSDKIDENTIAIVVVHLAGVPARIDQIKEICNKNNVYLIEDGAHSHGSKFNEKPIGSFGDAGIFSFYPSKTVPGPEGGAIVTDDSNLSEFARKFINVGRSSYGPFLPDIVGYNYRMSEFQAITIFESYKNLDLRIKIRRKLVEEYKKRLFRYNFTFQIPHNGSFVSFYALLTLIPKNMSRNGLIQFLDKNGISTSIMYHSLTEISNLLGAEKSHLNNTLDVTTRVIALPLHDKLKLEDINYVCDKIIEYCNSSQ